MTDRELLEKAAKAAGIRYDAEQSVPHPKSGCFWGLWLTFDGEPPENARRYFNPLTDDGDALRLAVKLQLIVSCAYGMTAAAMETGVHDDVVEFHHESDPQAATRRAIVRAAAAIGEAL
jgi:hypothetical protein